VGQPEQVGPFPTEAPAFADIALPVGAEVYIWRTAETISKGRHDKGTMHTVERIAWLPHDPSLADTWPLVGWPHWPARPTDPTRTLRFGRTRVYLADSTVFLEETWRHGPEAGPSYALHGLEGLVRQEELSDAWRGQQLLRHYDPLHPGRPAGGALADYSREELRQTYRELWAQHRREHLKRPTAWQFADKFGVDPRRVRDRLHDLGYLDWQAFVRDCQ
jgi:hypothetical protein